MSEPSAQGIALAMAPTSRRDFLLARGWVRLSARRWTHPSRSGVWSGPAAAALELELDREVDR